MLKHYTSQDKARSDPILEIWVFATLNNCGNRGQIVAIYLNCHDVMVVGSRGKYLRGLNFGL